MSERDLVERLTDNVERNMVPLSLMTAAAAEITRLRAEVARLRKAVAYCRPRLKLVAYRETLERALIGEHVPDHTPVIAGGPTP